MTPITIITTPTPTSPEHLPLSPLPLTTTDPYNTRVGSGGGTLAALTTALTSCSSPNEQTSVIIIHAGGQSSRCPTQMSLGKSWTSLPLKNKMETPAGLLISRLTDLLKDLPEGSAVVAASDTVLHLPPISIDWSDALDNAIVGVAVPAPVTTACNHGVYLLSNENNSTLPPRDDDDDGQLRPVNVTTFWQKPSVSSLETFGDNAWIDTGIVIFPPRAVKALQGLAKGVLRCCTFEGLKNEWEAAKESKSGDECLMDFAKNHAEKVDLYSHLIMALGTSEKVSWDEYYLKFRGELSKDILYGIYSALSCFDLRVLPFSEGLFLHLGTSRELVDFLVHKRDDQSTCAIVGKRLGLVKSYNSLVTPPSCLKDVVCCNSLMQTTGKLDIGRGCVLEHLHVLAECDITIGRDCLISGLRGEYYNCNTNITIPAKTCLQLMPLKEGDFVLIIFGLEDNIKKWDTYCGMNAHAFIQQSGLQNVWDEEEKEEKIRKKMLWNAKLHPRLRRKDLDTLPQLLQWMHHFQSLPNNLSPSDMQHLNSMKRLSLQEIGSLVDAGVEWTHRRHLEQIIIPFSVNLWERKHHEECDEFFDNGPDKVLLKTLENSAAMANALEKYDVADRALTLVRALFPPSPMMGVGM